jgi:hypothetical protein
VSSHPGGIDPTRQTAEGIPSAVCCRAKQDYREGLGGLDVAPPGPEEPLLPGEVVFEELPGELLLVPEEALPLDGEVVEPAPPAGAVAPGDGREAVAVPLLLPLEFEPELLLEPELSQAASDTVERNAAAISHFLFIRSSPFNV